MDNKSRLLAPGAPTANVGAPSASSRATKLLFPYRRANERVGGPLLAATTVHRIA